MARVENGDGQRHKHRREPHRPEMVRRRLGEQRCDRREAERRNVEGKARLRPHARACERAERRRHAAAQSARQSEWSGGLGNGRDWSGQVYGCLPAATPQRGLRLRSRARIDVRAQTYPLIGCDFYSGPTSR